MNDCGLASLLISIALSAVPCGGTAERVGDPIPLPLAGPQAIAFDSSDGSLWISSGASHSILHLDRSLNVVGSFRAQFPTLPWNAITGVAYWPARDTLLLVQPYLNEIWEVEKDGSPTGLVVSLGGIPRPVNDPGVPYVKGIAFDPGGDGGRGSIWLVESVMTAIYEITLEGSVLRSFCHPDDRDGCPGLGTSAPSGGIGLYAERGVPLGLELIGGRVRRSELLRVDFDGIPTGLRWPLEDVGGNPGGFLRLEGAGREGRDLLLVTVESSAELHVLELGQSSVAPISDLACEASDRSVSLRWQSRPGYEGFQVFRDGEPVASLPSSADRFEDLSPGEGVVRYEVVARASECESRLECAVVVGAGRVLASAPVDARYPMDLAEDSDGNLWVAAFDNRIFVYAKDLSLLAAFPGPFLREDDALTAIAYNPSSDTFFVYNAATNEVLEIDRTGAWVREPFPSGVPSDPEHPAVVTAMLFDPAGAGGEGSFWYLDVTSAALEERRRSGDLLRRCLHPDALAEPFPHGSDLGPYTGGLTAVPGSSAPLLELTGGPVRAGRLTRVLRVDPRTCSATGYEIPLDDVARLRIPTFLGIHRTVHDGRPVLYGLLHGYPRGTIVEMDGSEPVVPRITALSCRQPSEKPEVELRFFHPGGLDAVEVFRDGEVVAALSGDATSFLDRGAPSGVRTYEVRGVRGGLRGDAAACTLRVGVGSVRAQAFSYPATAIHQVSLDRGQGEYVAASLHYSVSDSLFRFGMALGFLGTIPSPFVAPEQVAALAVRSRDRVTEIYCLGWNPGASHETQGRFPMAVIDRSGTTLRRFILEVPKPRPEFVVFPSGMAWDSGTDTLWLLERNSRTIVQYALDGQLLSAFSHPAPIHQDLVYDYGLAVDGSRGTLYLASAGRYDREITRIVEVSRYGALTGFEIPVGRPHHETVRGFSISNEGRDIVAAVVTAGVSDLVSYRAFGPLPPVERLACANERGFVRLAWSASQDFDSIAIERDGELAVVLPGNASFWVDEAPGWGPGIYRVVGRKGDLVSPTVLCGPVRSRVFLRGDVEENRRLNISDAIAILSYLFLGWEAPACPKAADADDSGRLDITDAIALLNYLFLSGREPPKPFPLPGLDPTDDALDCPP